MHRDQELSRKSAPRALAGLGPDIRHACRTLARQPSYSVLAVLAIALGVAATTTLFSLAYGVLFRPLPWPHADRIVRLYESRKGATNRFGAIMTSAPYVAWQERPTTIDGLAGWANDRAVLEARGTSGRVVLTSATASLFPLLGVSPLLGTTYTEADETLKAQAPIVLSYGLWQGRFGASREVIGQEVKLDHTPYRIVGVMPRGFVFPDASTQAWTPMAVRFTPGGLSIFSALARLKPGITPAQAAAEATARARGGPDPGVVVMAVFGSREPAEISATPFLEAQTAGVRPAILVFLAAVALLLVTAAANVASVQLARATAKRREMAIRVAIGAGGGRLVRQALVENLVLGVAAAIVGLLLVTAIHRVLPSLLPPTFPRVSNVHVDLVVAVFAFSISIVASLACGLFPALQARRVNVVELLADNGQAPAGAGIRLGSSRARTLIMVGQLAIACVLLVGASLLTRSFLAMLAANRGYDPTGVLTATLVLPERSFTAAQTADIAGSLVTRLKTVPAFRHVAVASVLPLMSEESLASFPVRTYTGEKVQAQAANRVVTDGYFAALGIRVVAGRAFGLQDTRTSAPVVMVNRAFARQYLGPVPVGAKLWEDTPKQQGPEVIGVVEDIRHRSVTDSAAPEIYSNYAQSTGSGMPMTLAIKTVGRTSAHAATLRALVRQVDPAIDVDAVTPMETLLGATLSQPRLYFVLSAALAALSLTIAAVGLFGVLGYAVAQRTREIGVRTALGARPSQVALLVLRQAFVMATGGVVVGLAVSFVAAKSLGSFLYGITAYDSFSYVVVPLAILAAAAIAALVPARRAARVDPLTALRG